MIEIFSDFPYVIIFQTHTNIYVHLIIEFVFFVHFIKIRLAEFRTNIPFFIVTDAKFE